MQVFTSKIALEAKTDCDYNRLQSWMKKGAQSMECTKKKRIRQIITATTAALTTATAAATTTGTAAPR